jgi:NTP pyrophosphatase (non-canonical NTP hydrolase)
MLEKYKDKQMIIAIEELSELQKEISKKLRGTGSNIDLCEEIADVLICLEYIKEYYKLDINTIERFKEIKIIRTKALYL